MFSDHQPRASAELESPQRSEDLQAQSDPENTSNKTSA
jgi:hypothetical protein